MTFNDSLASSSFSRSFDYQSRASWTSKLATVHRHAWRTWASEISQHSEYSLPASEVQEGGIIPDAVLAKCGQIINSFPPRRKYSKKQPKKAEEKKNKKDKSTKKTRDTRRRKRKKECLQKGAWLFEWNGGAECLYWFGYFDDMGFFEINIMLCVNICYYVFVICVNLLVFVFM